MIRCVALLLAFASLGSAQDLRISVFGLFHPRRLIVRAAPGSILRLGGRKLEGKDKAVIDAGTLGRNGRTRVDTGRGDFILAVPGKIHRQFRGTLEVSEHEGILRAIVITDLESAVASAVAAESAPNAGLEALKAQAVVSRSFYVSPPKRHKGFDFCDTTHCQFFRAAPKTGSKFWVAAEETRGLVLNYAGQPLPAFYSANCGGHTHPSHLPGYPYFSVDCPVHGPRRGHGMGLCQRGAAELAREGLDFQEILHHYFPATSIGVYFAAIPLNATP